MTATLPSFLIAFSLALRFLISIVPSTREIISQLTPCTKSNSRREKDISSLCKKGSMRLSTDVYCEKIIVFSFPGRALISCRIFSMTVTLVEGLVLEKSWAILMIRTHASLWEVEWWKGRLHKGHLSSLPFSFVWSVWGSIKLGCTQAGDFDETVSLQLSAAHLAVDGEGIPKECCEYECPPVPFY